VRHGNMQPAACKHRAPLRRWAGRHWSARRRNRIIGGEAVALGAVGGYASRPG
jgi:hypothetical protein